MALTKCRECGHDVSTEAASCPQCGAKPKKESRIAPLFLVLVGLVGLLSILGWFVPKTKDEVAARETASSQENIEAQNTSVKLPAPSHYYVWSEGGQFGYQKELSHDAKMRGDATEALFIITPRGTVPQGHEFISIDNGVATVFSCVEPCDVVKTNGSLGPHVIPAPEGSVLWAVIEDSRHNQFRAKSVSPGTGNAQPVATAPTRVVEVAADPLPPEVSTASLYREYFSDPPATNAKYEGRRIKLHGEVIAAHFNDGGVGHLRMVLADGGGSGTTDSVVICFTESCDSARYPTVTDEQFKELQVGGLVRATCTAEPVKVLRAQEPKLVSLSLSKCSMP